MILMGKEVLVPMGGVTERKSKMSPGTVEICLKGHPVFMLGTQEVSIGEVRSQEGERRGIEKVIGELKEACLGLQSFGLAAPQLNYARRIFVVRSNSGQLITFINPQLEETSSVEYEEEKEWCFSVPGFGCVIKRQKEITVKYWDERFEERRVILEGREARAFQHEIHHLNGVWITDLYQPQGTYDFSTFKSRCKKMSRQMKGLGYLKEYKFAEKGK